MICLPLAAWRCRAPAAKTYYQGGRVMKRGHRGDFATPMDQPGRLALLARALPAIALSRSAHSRWPLEVGQAGRAGIFGIIWRVLPAYRYLERSREPSRQLASPIEFSRTRITSRPTRALETSEKCARFKENERRAIEDPRGGKGGKKAQGEARRRRRGRRARAGQSPGAENVAAHLSTCLGSK